MQLVQFDLARADAVAGAQPAIAPVRA
jgi:hypothetical protein